MDFRVFINAVFFTAIGTIGAAQDYDAKSFEDAVNEAISDMPGVTFRAADGEIPGLLKPQADTPQPRNLASHTIENAPEFSFVISDPDGQPVDIISGDAPFSTLGNKIEITGYELPDGFTVNTVGKAGYLDAVSDIAQRVEAPSDDVAEAVQTVKGASAYIVQELCSAAGRPTEITLNLTAGFQLVFGVETGSAFHWDLEVVCSR